MGFRFRVPSLRVRHYDLGARVSIQGVRLRGVKHRRVAKYRCLMYRGKYCAVIGLKKEPIA